MLYILSLKDPTSFLILQIFILYQGLNWRFSDPETDDIPMCQNASLKNLLLVAVRGSFINYEMKRGRGFAFVVHKSIMFRTSRRYQEEGDASKIWGQNHAT